MTDKAEDQTFDIDPEAIASDTERDNKPKEDPRKGLPPGVQVEEAQEPFIERQPTEEELSDPGPWIQYNGVGIVRVMGPDEWKAVKNLVPGLPSTDDYYEWNSANNKRVPRSEFNDHQLQYLLRIDGRFSLETEPLPQTVSN